MNRRLLSFFALLCAITAFHASAQDTPLTGVQAIVTGAKHTCALTSAGGVLCWGDNTDGQLGDGGASGSGSSLPVAVQGLASGVSALAAGNFHACALLSGGSVKCWGFNDGRLGDGGTATQATPVDVRGLPAGISAISAGSFHTCALTSGGTVKCWGSNSKGQLGNNSVISSLSPVDVSSLTGVRSIAAGEEHTCAVTQSNTSWCWGRNDYGQVGDGGTTNRTSPVPVSGLNGSSALVSAGDFHTCAVTTAGSLRCWGLNNFGQVGDGGVATRLTPVAVAGVSGVNALSAGRFHTCAVVGNSGLCWGRNQSSQLGDGTTSNRLVPTPLGGPASSLLGISSGDIHSCAVTTTGGAKCWGDGANGKLGRGNLLNQTTPVDVLADTTPNAFAFETQASVPINTLRVSNTITPTGYSASAPISISNGSYSINCTGSFVTTAGTISPGSTLCVRHISSNLFDTVFTTTVTIGSASATFSSRTAGQLAVLSTGSLPVATSGQPYSRAIGASGGTPPIAFRLASGVLPSGLTLLESGTLSGTPLTAGLFTFRVAVSDAGGQSAESALTLEVLDGDPDPFGFLLQTGVPANSVRLSNSVTLTGFATAVPMTVTNGEYSIGCNQAYVSVPTTVQPGTSVCLRHPSASSPGGITTTTLVVGGRSGTFTSVVGTAAVEAVTVIKTGQGIGRVIALQGGIDCGSDCGESYPRGTPVTLVATAAPDSRFDGWAGACWGTGVCDLTLDGPKSVTATFTALPPAVLNVAPNALSFGSQPVGSPSTAQTVSIANAGGAPISITSVTASNPQFVPSQNCSSVPGGQSCAVSVAFTPSALGSRVGTLTIVTNSGTRTVDLSGVGVASQSFTANVDAVVTGYYETILGRSPDAGGLAFWSGEATRVSQLGADVREVFYAMAMQFFASPEYVGRNTPDDQFIRDLYQTFFSRAADADGLAYWLGELAAVRSRSALLNSFLFSSEFANAMTGLFGSPSIRPEVNLTMDLFRGVVGRLPDNAGFAYWRDQLRAAQCQGGDAVNAKVAELANLFFGAPEYAQRARNERDFMGDVYNTYLRRGPGGDADGFNYWVSESVNLGWDGVRSFFVPSAEFQARVAAIVAAGCL